MATDRAGIVKAGEAGVAEISNSLVSKSTWGGLSADEVEDIYAELPTYDYDVEKAQQLAADAGVDGQQIVIATSPISVAADVIAQATAQAGRDIGLDVKIKTVSPDQYTALFSSPAARKGIDMFMTAWYTSLADPMEMYGVLQTGQFSNYGSWSDPDFDAQTDQAIADPIGEPARTTAMANAQAIAAEQRRGSRCTHHRPRSGWVTGSPASHRRSTTCTTRGPRPSEPRAEEHDDLVRGPQARGHGAHDARDVVPGLRIAVRRAR